MWPWLLTAVGAMLVAVGAGGAQAAGGALDPTFGRGGKVLTGFGTGTDAFAQAVALQADGKIVVAGTSDANGDDDFVLVRYRVNGTLDGSFGRGGKVLTDFGGDDKARGVALQADGKIVAVGQSKVRGGHDFAVARYTTRGKLDSSFGRAGKVRTNLGATDNAYAVAVQRNGRIVVGGLRTKDAIYGAALVRYTRSGGLDPTFGVGGKVVASPGLHFETANALVVQSDGKIVAAGASDDQFALVRYTSTGGLDRSFGRSGEVRASLGGTDAGVQALALQADGRLIAAGTSYAEDPSGDFAVVRYTPAGKLDTSFAMTGELLTDLDAQSLEKAHAVAIQRDGKIIVAGSSSSLRRSDDFGLVRYTSGGKLDQGFGKSGVNLADLGGGSDDTAYGVAVQTDGRIVAVGISDSPAKGEKVALVRYTK